VHRERRVRHRVRLVVEPCGGRHDGGHTAKVR
jgi:hypothetical protein